MGHLAILARVLIHRWRAGRGNHGAANHGFPETEDLMVFAALRVLYLRVPVFHGSAVRRVVLVAGRILDSLVGSRHGPIWLRECGSNVAPTYP